MNAMLSVPSLGASESFTRDHHSSSRLVKQILGTADPRLDLTSSLHFVCESWYSLKAAEQCRGRYHIAAVVGSSLRLAATPSRSDCVI